MKPAKCLMCQKPLLNNDAGTRQPARSSSSIDEMLHQMWSRGIPVRSYALAEYVRSQGNVPQFTPLDETRQSLR